MKNTILTLLIFISLISCKTSDIDYTKSDLNSIALYDFTNKPITAEQITKQWNERIQKNEEINARITKLEIINLTDEGTNKNELVLLGNTNRNSVMTSTKLTKFKNGLKLSDIVATCKNCNSKKINLGLNSGNWYCIDDSEDENDNCTKIVTMETE